MSEKFSGGTLNNIQSIAKVASKYVCNHNTYFRKKDNSVWQLYM